MQLSHSDYLESGTSEKFRLSFWIFPGLMDTCDEGKQHLVVRGFHVFLSKRLGGRFIQQVNFISDIEEFVPRFYGNVGSFLTNWKKPAPKIKLEKPTADDVSAESIAEDAEGFGE